MNKETGSVCATGLLFFSKTNRLISHDLKNILAIISETSGLMNELLEMRESGADLPPGKIRALSNSIIKEVARANDLTRCMNSFAHTVDILLAETDVVQTVTLAIAISRLDADLQPIRFPITANKPCPVYTSPLFLQNLVYNTLKQSLGNSDAGAPPETKIPIILDDDGRSIHIVFSGLAAFNQPGRPTAEQAFLAKTLSATITVDAADNDVRIVLPKNPDLSILSAIRPPTESGA